MSTPSTTASTSSDGSGAVSKSRQRRNRKNKAANAAASAAAVPATNGHAAKPTPAAAPAVEDAKSKLAAATAAIATAAVPVPIASSSNGVAAATKSVASGDGDAKSSKPASTTTAASDTAAGPPTAATAATAATGTTPTRDQKSAASIPAGSANSAATPPYFSSKQPPIVLSADQLKQFKERGYLVVPGILSAAEVASTRTAYHKTLATHYGIDIKDLAGTAKALKPIHIAGGILEIFYPSWKLAVASNERLYRVVTQLYGATYAPGDTPGFEQSYGKFDNEKLLMYIDRTNFRLPTQIAQHLGNGRRPLQGGLNPHVDSNPYELYNWWTVTDGRQKSRWRPIQSFVTLTEVKGADTGGFEFIPGFHREFDEFFQAQTSDKVPRQPAYKEHFQLHPNTHPNIYARLKKDLRMEAGSAVFWDWRVVHCNADANDSKQPREVIYTGFLPDIALNRKYVADQLARYRNGGVLPYDFRPDMVVDALPATAAAAGKAADADAEIDRDPTYDAKYEFTELGQRMFGLKTWDGVAIAAPAAKPAPPKPAAATAATAAGGASKMVGKDGGGKPAHKNRGHGKSAAAHAAKSKK